VCKEVFAWGKYGGFGNYVRVVGSQLVRRGVQVLAVIPKSQGQRSKEEIDGTTVLGLPYPTSLLDSVPSELSARVVAPWVYAKCQADIYHSINPMFYTCLAQLAVPSAKHVIAFSDLRDVQDWRKITRVQSFGAVANSFREHSFESGFMGPVVRRADGRYAFTESLADKAVRMFGLENRPPVLRQPIEVPRRKIRKSSNPTVCFLGRLDPIKRPRLFFDLAKEFPAIEFHVMGRTTVPQRYPSLIEGHRHLKNLKFHGWTFEGQKSKVLERSWVLVNTSIHEALPTAFLEAWAHECAVLSGVNPDGLVDRFGQCVRDDGYAEGLRKLLASDVWREMGREGRRYVERQHAVSKAVEELLLFYRTVMSR
jgi:glycosyltransferase involved in cell wall biosynthesis